MRNPRLLILSTLLAVVTATVGACHYNPTKGVFVCDREDYTDLGANPVGGIRFVKWNPACAGPSQLPGTPYPFPLD